MGTQWGPRSVASAEPPRSNAATGSATENDHRGRLRRRTRVIHGGQLLKQSVGVVAMVLLWELAARTVFAGRHVLPPPGSVLVTAVRDHFYLVDLQVTLWEALRGWIIGVGLAALLAAVAAFVKPIQRPMLSFGVITYAVPTIAIGPLLLVVLSPDTTIVIMAALPVFFVTLEGALAGLRSAAPALLDLVAAYGGGELTKVLRIRARSALPMVGAALAISGPAAILGAMIGEYLGGRAGLGVVMASAEQSLQVSRTWSVAMVTTAVSGMAFAVLHLPSRKTVHRAGTGDAEPAAGAGRATGRYGRIGSAAASSARGLLTMIAVLAAWQLGVSLSGLSSYLAKSPGDVYGYLLGAPNAGSHLDVVMASLAITTRDAMSGWLVGSFAAVIGAVALTRFTWLSSSIMPVVIVLRSVPLVAMTPLIALIVGRGPVGVAAIAGIVTFVPSLVLVSQALADVPELAVSLVEAYGGTEWDVLWRLRFRYGVPALFAAAKVAMPGCVLGAVLAEWLVTSSGLGHLMAQAVVFSNFDLLWSSVAIVSALSVALYLLASGLETWTRNTAT